MWIVLIRRVARALTRILQSLRHENLRNCTRHTFFFGNVFSFGEVVSHQFRKVESYLKDAGMAGLGDGQTGAEGAPSQGGRGDALFRRMPPY